MNALGVLLAPLPEILVEICEGSDFRHGDEGVAAAVAHLVLHIALLIAGCRIAEVCLKAVMQHETVESVCENAIRSPEHLGNGSRHVVEPQPGGNSADMLKDPFHSFQQTFLILRGKHLRVAFVGVREGNGQCIAGMLLFVAAVVQHFAEVHLSPALRMGNGKITAAFSTHGELLLAHIALDAGIASGVSVLVAEPTEHSPHRMPLLSGHLPIRFQPLVYDGDELSQHRIAFRLQIRKFALAPVILVGVLLDRVEAVVGPARNFSQA